MARGQIDNAAEDGPAGGLALLAEARAGGALDDYRQPSPRRPTSRLVYVVRSGRTWPAAGGLGSNVRVGVTNVSIKRDKSQSDRLRAQLLGPKRHDVLSLSEVIEAGRTLTGDREGMAFYGLPPSGWYARGIRLLGRTCVEATPDITAQPIARTAHALLGARQRVGVVDLFAGSGNLLLHVAQGLSAPACGLEADEAVWRQTDTNLRILGAPPAVRLGDWQSYFEDPLNVDTTVYLLSPPWGNAFSFASGLDLARTEPPIPLIIDTIATRDRSIRCYALIQHTPIEPVANVSAVTDRYPIVGFGRGCFLVCVR